MGSSGGRETRKQGDPMAAIFFAVALQQAIIDIDRDVRDNQPDVATAGAMGFADDVDPFGPGVVTPQIDLVRRCLGAKKSDNTGSYGVLTGADLTNVYLLSRFA